MPNENDKTELNQEAASASPQVEVEAQEIEAIDAPITADVQPAVARHIAPGSADRGARKGRGNASAGGGRGPSDRGGRPGSAQAQADDAERSEWKEKVIQIRRVTKVVKGGKKLSFRAVVIVGNGKGEVGIGVGKSNEVIGAIQKGVAAAKKSLIKVPMHNTTIPHPIQSKAGGSVVVLRPASEGTGILAGGAVRAVVELAGIENILSKSLGSNSPLNSARATLKGLADLRTFEHIARNRGKSVREILL